MGAEWNNIYINIDPYFYNRWATEWHLAQNNVFNVYSNRTL